MIVVDVNLLIYAVNRDAPAHRRARKWLETVLSGTETVGFSWAVVLAFIRITTRHGILQKPLPTATALAYLDEWLSLPHVEVLAPGEAHWRILSSLLKSAGSAGNLTSDAHLAALALEHGAALHSADYDFQRFPGLEHVNPLR